MSIKEKILSVTQNLQSLLEDSKENNEITVQLQLSEEQALILQLIKIFVKAADETLTESEIFNMIFRSGLVYELEKMKETKQKIYDMGNIEMLADENNIGLTDESREIASAVIAPPKSIDEYWQLGYTTMCCPYCQARAVRHPESQKYQCIDGCRKSGELEGDYE